MSVKRFVIPILLSLSLTVSVMSIASASVTPRTKCSKVGAKQTFKGKTYTCIKLGSKLYWNNGKRIVPPKTQASPSPSTKPTTTPTILNLRTPSIPLSFDFSTGKNLVIDLTIETNVKINTPKSQLEFKINSGQWSVPSQTRTIIGSVREFRESDGITAFKLEFDLTDFDPIGRYTLTIDQFTSSNSALDLASNFKRTYSINLNRDYWRKSSITSVTALPAYEYLSFKGQKFKKFPWEGKNVVLLTDGSNYDPFVMSRILNALDAAYESYSEITQFKPGIARAYQGKLSIAEMTPETVGCGAACGYLGATGIEIQTPLFLRLYNGVRDHDQFDEPLFYELGRNFWNYGKYKQVLEGDSKSSKWFDINTTGFAVFMRYLVTELNDIPIGPNDGPNKPGLEFKEDMLNLMVTQRDSKTDTFSSTFFSTKFDSYGFGVWGFWSSLIYYFMPAENRQTYVQNFLAALAKQKTPNSVAESVDNVVIAIGAALGRDIATEFYKDLRFEDVKSNR